MTTTDSDSPVWAQTLTAVAQARPCRGIRLVCCMTGYPSTLAIQV